MRRVQSNTLDVGIDVHLKKEWANTRKGYWRCTRAFLQNAIEDEALRKAGYPMLSHLYKQITYSLHLPFVK